MQVLAGTIVDKLISGYFKQSRTPALSMPGIRNSERLFRFHTSSLLDGILASDDADQDHDDGNHEEDMDKGIDRKSGYEAQEPENDENRRDCSEHGVFFD